MAFSGVHSVSNVHGMEIIMFISSPLVSICCFNISRVILERQYDLDRITKFEIRNIILKPQILGTVCMCVI